jgi:hypothetical protein
VNQQKAEEFVAIWQGASSPADAAERLGMKQQNAQAKAIRLRKAGVPLKKFQGKYAGLNVAKLSEIAS